MTRTFYRHAHALAVVLDYALIALALWILLGEPRHNCCKHKEEHAPVRTE